MPVDNLDDALARLRIEKSRKRPVAGGRSVRWIVVLAVVVAALVAGAQHYRTTIAPLAVEVRAVEPEAAAPAEGEVVVTASGYVVPRRKVEVTSKIIGRVKEIPVRQGQFVHQGDVLLRLEDEDLAAQLRIAEAQENSAAAGLALLQAGSRPEDIAAARAQVAAAEATRVGAKQELDRMSTAAKQGAVAKQDLDRARATYDAAAANVEAARKRAEVVALGPRREEIDGAQAREREARAAVEYARTQLDYTVVRAPTDGTILEKIAEVGDLVTNINFGGTRGAKSSVVAMADLRDLLVEVDLGEADIGKASLGQKCEVRLESAPDLRLAGAVDEIAPQADRQKATVQVKVRLIEPAGQVRPEISAQVRFLADAPDFRGQDRDEPQSHSSPRNPGQQPGEGSALTSGSLHVQQSKEVPSGRGLPAPAQVTRLRVPRSAIVQQPGKGGKAGSAVYVVVDGKAVLRPVTTGEETERGVEVREGLAAGDQVIVRPPESLADGRRVRLLPAAGK